MPRAMPISFRVRQSSVNLETSLNLAKQIEKKKNRFYDKKIAIVDDDENSLVCTQLWLENIGEYKNVRIFNDPNDLIDEIRNNEYIPDLVISDIEMSSKFMDGFILRFILKSFNVTDIIFFTAHTPESVKQYYSNFCVKNIYYKPVDSGMLTLIHLYFEKNERNK